MRLCARGLICVGLACSLPLRADPAAGPAPSGLEYPDDPRVRDVAYSPNAVYRLTGRVGYQIDIEFEAGEKYLGLAAGDVNGLSFESQDNHVFLKPKAVAVATNLTILTDRRHYYFEYAVSPTRATVTPASDTLFACDSATRGSWQCERKSRVSSIDWTAPWTRQSSRSIATTATAGRGPCSLLQPTMMACARIFLFLRVPNYPQSMSGMTTRPSRS